MRKGALLLFLGMVIFSTAAGCSRREESVPGGTVKASEAYLRHFGAAPTVKEGSCFALVGYFPLNDNPLQVRPVPLFIFSRDGQMDKVVRHLMALDGGALGKGEGNPFPAGTQLKSLSVKEDSAVVQLAFGAGLPQDRRVVQGIVSALGYTLAQFPGVRRVLVEADGTPLPGVDRGGFVPDARNILEPELPRPIGVAGVWEGNAATPEEVLIAFDRPVALQKVEVLAEGKPLSGDYYQSAFDMAVVIRPGRGEAVREGMPVRVEWQVRDRLGRSSSGGEDFPLQRQNRP